MEVKLKIGKRYVVSTKTTRVMTFIIRDRKDLRLFKRMRQMNLTIEPA